MADYGTYTDEELVSLLKAGSSAGFEAIYERHWQAAYQAALNVLRDEDACMDVLQDVFVWLWDHREQVNIASLRTYILTAVKFKMLNVIRHNRLRDAAYAYLPPVDGEPDFSGSSVEVKELRAMIDEFAENLPGKAREIFHMSRNEYLSNREIAERLGISEKTVKNQLNISLGKLRKSLKNLSCWLAFFC